MENFLAFQMFGDDTSAKLAETSKIDEAFSKSVDPVAQFLVRSRLQDFLGKSDGGFDPDWNEPIGIVRKISPSTISSEPRGVPSPRPDGVYREVHGEVGTIVEYRNGSIVRQEFEYPDGTTQIFGPDGIEIEVDSVAEARSLADAPAWTIAKKLGIVRVVRKIIDGTRWSFGYSKAGDLVDARIY